MAFKNLEQRFNEKINELYGGAKLKFENGRPSNGANDDPLITRKPGDGYWGFGEGRGAPVRSAAQDVKRLTLFTFSVRGISFLAKQQVLQTGNTFESTRIINPAFILSNAIPFVHAKRAIDVPITARGIGRLLLGNSQIAQRIFGSGAQKKDETSLRKIGQLQLETYNKVANKKDLIGGVLKKIPVIGQTVNAVRAKRSVGDGIHEYANSRPELSTSTGADVAATVLRFVGLSSLGSSLKKTDNSNYIMTKYVKDTNRFQNGQTTIFTPLYKPTNSAYKTYLKFSNDEFKWVPITGKADDYKKGLDLPIIPDETQLRNLISENAENQLVPTENRFRADVGVIDQKLKEIRTDYKLNRQNWYNENSGKEGPMPYLKYFTGDRESITDGSSFDPINSDGTNARDLANTPIRDKSKKISYIKDLSNKKVYSEGKNIQEAYKYINNNPDTNSNGWDDPITVSFAMGNDEPIRFRAFVKELTESSNPQYQSLQYIGRVEKFINYTGVQREASFKLAILAFSKDELEGVWRRINYLTGLTFPYGFSKGLLQPNIVRLTIGNVYLDQPGYISSLNKNFNEPSETWDLDLEVPIGATLDMKFTIIEKSARVADSPFHGIFENPQIPEYSTGFASNIDIPDSVISNLLDPTKAATAQQPITVNVSDRKPLDTSKLFIQNGVSVRGTIPNIPQPTLQLQQPPINFSSNPLRG